MVEETTYTEYRKGIAELDDAILSITAMINACGSGKAVFGIREDGAVTGIDIGEDIQETVSRRFSELVQATVVPRIDVERLENGRAVVTVSAEGSNRPYMFDGRFFFRHRKENLPVPATGVRRLFHSCIDMMALAPSLIQDLTFYNLALRLQSKGIRFQDMEQLCSEYGLRTPDGRYNLTAEQLSDQNHTDLRTAVFDGLSRATLRCLKGFTGRPFPDEVEQVLMYAEARNDVEVDLSHAIRKDTYLFDMDAFREAWINACVHNDWIYGTPPTAQFFDDRVEIISNGFIPYMMTEKDFFGGRCRPLNTGLMRVFTDLGLCGNNAHGVPLIVERYGREAFRITEHSVTVTLPYAFIPE